MVCTSRPEPTEDGCTTFCEDRRNLVASNFGVSRLYWLGRSAEAGAGGDARDYYRHSAHFGTTFYGQLSAAKLSEKAPELIYPRPTEADRTRFAGRPAVQAIKRLEQVGYSNRATTLYNQLSRELNSVGELALLAVMAERNEITIWHCASAKPQHYAVLTLVLCRTRSAQFLPMRI